MDAHRLWRTAAPTLLVAFLTLAPAAQAAPGLGNPSARPAPTAAGANANFDIAFDVTDLGAVGAGGDDLKSLRLDLPAGLAGNPQATGGRCTREQLRADACPESTKVGTTTTVADVLLLLVELQDQQIAGDIYNVVPSGGEAARLGIVLRPEMNMPKVILESPVTVRSGDGGLTSTVDDIPRTTAMPTGDADLRIERMTMTLFGKLPSGKAFMSNPTSCAPAPTTITIGTYANQRAAATPSFTPTACDALPFAPQLSARIGSTRDDVRAGAQPEVVVTVTQQAGEANARSVAVALPSGLGASVTALGNACPIESYNAGACPAESVVGSASATTPLLAAPLTGPVTFVSDPSMGLPHLRVALRGAFDVNLVGIVSQGPTGLVNTFDGIYDVPLSRFVLTIAAGPTSPLRAGRDLCLPGASDLSGTFVAHSGKTATSQAGALLTGCDDVRATAFRARIGRLRGGRPALRLVGVNPDRPLQSLRLRLPKGLKFTRRAKALSGVEATGSGVIGRVGLRKGVLSVRLSGNGAQKVDVLLERGAIRVARKLRRAKRPRLGRLRVAFALMGRTAATKRVRMRVVRRP